MEDCGKRCSHGGICILPVGGHVIHTTGLCYFTNEEAVTEAEGDAIYMALHKDGSTIAAMVIAYSPKDNSK